jgi:hypothetical protein
VLGPLGGLAPIAIPSQPQLQLIVAVANPLVNMVLVFVSMMCLLSRATAKVELWAWRRPHEQLVARQDGSDLQKRCAWLKSRKVPRKTGLLCGRQDVLDKLVVTGSSPVFPAHVLRWPPGCCFALIY